MARTGRPRSFDDRQVIEAAKEVFWQRGYTRTSMRELKNELGVLPGSLHGAFGDKHTFFLRALERYAEDAREAATALRVDGPALSRVRQFLTEALDAARSAPGRGCMLGNTAAEVLPEDEEAGRIIRRAFGELEAALEEALINARRAGEVRADVDCGAYARLLLALLQGLHVIARVERDPRRLDDAIDAALAAITASGADARPL
ncbi:TetR/AcrR family transcriptional regulator [Plantactinospora sp. S1510]|uniref:TetR/AcrR family transcriptional regulator n=1 Tax=Plantactinospora alkalitolerans TaxID=2789879 RepID=A0ABS0H587_9ACTN|nr:TetR/AcrR family transcriptional regulator [Plantactinospora alkalitolerans]MBF9133299.1 TetR/AcrR family transcriptional regulator [Plantactinospora alkalitolerans]